MVRDVHQKKDFERVAFPTELKFLLKNGVSSMPTTQI